MKGRAPLDEPVRIEAVFALPMGARADLDNLCKAALDALNKIVFRDDGLIVELHARKIFSDTPQTRIEVSCV